MEIGGGKFASPSPPPPPPRRRRRCGKEGCRRACARRRLLLFTPPTVAAVFSLRSSECVSSYLPMTEVIIDCVFASEPRAETRASHCNELTCARLINPQAAHYPRRVNVPITKAASGRLVNNIITRFFCLPLPPPPPPPPRIIPPPEITNRATRVGGAATATSGRARAGRRA
jgi:hypothetical protein